MEKTLPQFDLFKEERGERHGRYVAHIRGVAGEAEISYHKKGPGLISADRTLAPEIMRGTGAAVALVAFMVDDARKQGVKIQPLCPYVRAQYRRNPDWADVMTLAPGEEPKQD